MRLRAGGESRQIIAIALTCFACYANSFSGSFHYDDFHSIVENPPVRSLGNIPAFFTDMELFSTDREKGMYRPVLLTTFALNYAAGEYEVWGYLLVNLLIHLGCSIFVARIGGLMMGESVGLLCGLLFAVHPICTEPVNYVSSRSESLAALFYLGSFYYFAVHRTSGRAGGDWKVVIACSLGLLTKATVATLPAVILAFDLSQRKLNSERFVWRPFLKLHAPYWIALGLYIFVSWFSGFLPKSLGSPVRSGYTQVWTQLKAIPYYLQLLFVPNKLNVEHQFHESNSWQEMAVLLGLLLVVGLVLLALKWRRSFPLSFFLLWNLVVLLPASVMPLNMIVNERRLYLVVAGSVWLVAYALRGVQKPIAVALLVLLALQTVARNRVWTSELALWGDAVEKSPTMRRARANFGRALQLDGQHDEALGAYRKSIEIDPRHGDAYNNIATLYHESGNLTEPIRWYHKALRWYPGYDEIYINLGDAHFQKGEVDTAAQMFEKALSIDGTKGSTWSNYGLILIEERRFEEAAGAYEKAIELSPELAEPYNNLGNVLSAQGKHGLALERYQQAIARSPSELGEVEINIATTHLQLNQVSAAASILQSSIADGRGSATHYYHLGRAFSKQKKTEGAQAAFARARELDPTDARPLAALGELYADNADPENAIGEFRRALEIRPQYERALFGLGMSLDKTGSTTEAMEVYRAFLGVWDRWDDRRRHVERRLVELSKH